MTPTSSLEAKPGTSKRQKSEDEGVKQKKTLSLGDLEEVEARLYLLEKARMQGIVGYKQAPKDEYHGDSYYWVDRVPGGVRVRCKVGGLGYAEAQGRANVAKSKLAMTNKLIEGIEQAVIQHEQNPEIVSQMKEKLTGLLEEKAGYELTVKVAENTPEPYVIEKVLSADL